MRRLGRRSIERTSTARTRTRSEADLPVVLGEGHRRGGDYDFYPTRDTVTAWLAAASLEIPAEDTSPGTDYAFWHLLHRRATRDTPVMTRM